MKRRCQALVEFAILMPFAVLFMWGCLELIWMMGEHLAVQNATQAAAIFAMDSHQDDCSSFIIFPTCANVAPCYGDTGQQCLNDRVKCVATGFLPWRGGSDCRSPAQGDTLTLTGGWDEGDQFTVRLSHTYSWKGPFERLPAPTFTSSVTAYRR